MIKKNNEYDISHLLIIPDGFRRYAKFKNIEYSESYIKGAQLGLEVLDYFNTSSIFELSYFLVSHRTFKRNKESVNSIFNALNFFLISVIDSLIKNKYQFKINFLGDLDIVPIETLKLIKKINDLNNNSFDRTLNLLIAYSGSKSLYNNCTLLDGIKDKTNAIGESLEFNNFLKEVPTAISKIEVVIRSGYYFRLSDAPILETINSIFILINKFLPELSINDFTIELEKYINWKKINNYGICLEK